MQKDTLRFQIRVDVKQLYMFQRSFNTLKDGAKFEFQEGCICNCIKSSTSVTSVILLTLVNPFPKIILYIQRCQGVSFRLKMVNHFMKFHVLVTPDLPLYKTVSKSADHNTIQSANQCIRWSNASELTPKHNLSSGLPTKRDSNQSPLLQRQARIGIWLVTSLTMILSNKRITKALISLRGCAGCSATLLFANPEDRFSRIEAQLRIN